MNINQSNVPTDLYKAIEKALDDNSAWIARPSIDVTEAVARAAMEFYSASNKRAQKHMVMDGAIAAMEAINRVKP